MRVFMVKNDYCGSWQVIIEPKDTIDYVEEEVNNAGQELTNKEIKQVRSIASMRVGSERRILKGYVKVKCVKRSKKWVDGLPEGEC